MKAAITLSPTVVAGRLRGLLFALLLALLLALGGSVSLLSRDWATDDLTEALGGKAQQILTEIDRVLTEAWSVGIPFDHEDVVHQGFDYFNRLLQDNPEIRFVAVADLDQTLFFYEGTNRDRLNDLMASSDLAPFTSEDGLSRGGTGDRSVAVGDFSIRVGPLMVEGEPVAALYVGIDRRIADQFFGPRLWVIAPTFLATLLMGWLIICFAVDRFWTEPAHRLAHRLAAARQNRWNIVDSRREGGEFRGVARALNLVAADLRDRHDHATGLADEICSQALDPSVVEAATAARNRFAQDLPIRFTTGQDAEDGPGPAFHPTAGQRLVATGCLVLSGALLVPILSTEVPVAVTVGFGVVAGALASRFASGFGLVAVATTIAALAALTGGAVPAALYVLALSGGLAVGVPLAGGISAATRHGLAPAGFAGQTVIAMLAALSSGILIDGLADISSLPLPQTLGLAGAVVLGPALVFLLIALLGTQRGERHGDGSPDQPRDRAAGSGGTAAGEGAPDAA